MEGYRSIEERCESTGEKEKRFPAKKKKMPFDCWNSGVAIETLIITQPGEASDSFIQMERGGGDRLDVMARSDERERESDSGGGFVIWKRVF